MNRCNFSQLKQCIQGICWILVFGFALPSLRAQQSDLPVFNRIDQQPFVQVKKISEKIILDGFLKESFWSTIKPATHFAQNFPTDSINALAPSEVKMAYDDNFLYVGITCFAKSSHFITPSLRRDYDFFGNDNFTILFDTYNDKTNAFVFGINPYGVRREALVVNRGQQGKDFDESWDNKWDGAAKVHADYWTAELAIPFKTLRYTEGSTQWRFNAYRYDTQENEISTWIHIPRNRFTIDLGFMGTMSWEAPLKKPGKNISIIPYLATSAARDFEDDAEQKAQNELDFGGDAKLAISSGLNLDLTINPDFSQVEVDQQVTNLDRFELFFPEKRQFFLENADLFGGFAAGRINPFFSRRIGVTIDPNTEQNTQNTRNTILYGARLSGKINDKLRIGLLNMQTAKQEENALPGFNYTVATAEQQVFDRSVIAFMAINKQAVNPDNFNGGFYDYNRMIGIEYRLASANNKWTGKTTFQKTFTPELKTNDGSHFTQVILNERKYRLEWVHLYIGNNFNPEVGFAPRRDLFMISPEASINFFPKNSRIGIHTLGFDASFFYKLGKDNNTILPEFGRQEINIEPFWSFRLKNSSNLRFQISYNNLILLNNFDPTRIQKETVYLPAGSKYSFTDFSFFYQSDRRKIFNYTINPLIGSFYNGFRAGIEGSFTFRYQPFGFISLDYTYNHIKLNAPFETANLWLIGPRIDLTFTKQLFLTTFIQYNSQSNNLNINARFQWRFKPVSDFFIVYTDNYLTESFGQFGNRNRALVAKLTYWFNL